MTAAPFAALRTKLVCTLGPATAGREAELVGVGMDVARLNFSHGTAAARAAAAEAVRVAGAAVGRPVAILADLSGPKIRTGDLRDGAAELEPGASLVLAAGRSAGIGDSARVAVAYRRLAADLRPGDRVLLGDGAVELRVDRIEADEVVTEVVRGGTIRSRTGVSIPSDRRSTGPLTARDRSDARTLAELGADYVAQSFVRRAEDIGALRRLLGNDGPPIIAKIETRPAIDRFDEILERVDGVMVARGDLGVELPFEEVPLVQKQLVGRALDRGVPTIVATQMLESMITAPRPTRAEASDVANAVFDGADAIMLSGETAIGQFPVLAADAAVRIVRHCEVAGRAFLPGGAPHPASPDTGRDAGSDAWSIAYAAAALARTDPRIAAIACHTRTGRTARMLSALRPAVPILAFSPDRAVVARLALVHGVLARASGAPLAGPARLEPVASLVRATGLIQPGSAVVLVASTAQPGSGPNLLEVHRLPD